MGDSKSIESHGMLNRDPSEKLTYGFALLASKYQDPSSDSRKAMSVVPEIQVPIPMVP